MATPPAEGLAKRAIANSARYGAALLLSWVLAFAGRLLVPSALGKERYGQLSFIESVTILAMSLLSVGADTYIQKEVSARPSHAVEFMRPLVRFRISAGVVFAGIFGLGFGLAEGGRDHALVAATFGLGQLAVLLGQSNASYLHAIQKVGAVSWSAIATKVLWFLTLGALLLFGPKMMALPAALLVSEVLRNLWLRRAVRREFGPEHHAPMKVAFGVMRRSLPYYIDSVNGAFTVYNLPIILGAFSTSDEVGLYTAAAMAMSVPMLFTPLFASMAMPVFSKLRVRGEEVMWQAIRDMIDATIVMFGAASVVLLSMSNVVMNRLFGREFADGAAAFGVMAMAFPATYLTMVLGGACIADGTGWRNTRVNLTTMVGMVVSGVILVPLVGHAHGGRSALVAASILAAFEWITVAWLWSGRPFGRLSRATIVGCGLVVLGWIEVGIAIAWPDQHHYGHILGACIGLSAAAYDTPRLLRTMRRILQSRGDAVEPSDPVRVETGE